LGVRRAALAVDLQLCDVIAVAASKHASANHREILPVGLGGELQKSYKRRRSDVVRRRKRRDVCATTTRGGGSVPVGRAVFKTVGGLRSKPRWVRLPSIPAFTSPACTRSRSP